MNDVTSGGPPPRPTSLRTLVADSAIYGAGMVLARGLGFFMTPILARTFTVEEFGVLDLLQTAALFAGMLLSMQMESALLRYYGDDEDKQLLLSTYLIAQFGVASVFLVIVGAVGGPLFASRYVEVTRPTIYAAASSVAVGLQWTHALTLLRAERSVKFASSMIALDTVLNLASVFLLVVWWRAGIAGYFAARTCSNLVSCIMVFGSRRDRYAARFSWPVFRRFLRFGLPLTPEGLISFATAQTGKLFLLWYTSLTEVGLLAVANRVATGLKLIMMSLRQAWMPFVYAVANEADSNKSFARAFQGYTRIAAFLLFAFVLVSKEAVLLLAGPQYLQARWLLGFVGAAAVIGGLPYLFNIGLLLGERTEFYTVGVAAAAVTTIVSGWFLIGRLGIVGAPLSGLLGALVLSALVLYFSEKIRPISYDMRVLVAFITITIATAALGATRWVEGSLVIRLTVLALITTWMLRKIPIAGLIPKFLLRPVKDVV